VPQTDSRSASGWIDISVPVIAGMVSFPGDPLIFLERASSMSSGAICNVSRLDFGVHSGTHIDAPIHFVEGAPAIESVPLDACIGPALVVDASAHDRHLDAAAIRSLSIPAGTRRVLFRWNSHLWREPGFQSGFLALAGDGAAALVDLGVELVGNDYLSIAPFDDPIPAHLALLDAGVVVVEGLDLTPVGPGEYDLVCVPLLIPGSDGGPARALLRRLR
jgi:arylformamidase